ncbi:MAG: hypothetical protein EXR71_13180 [Myxococcales bacterium]|nr:hypothetical protein [Myxococcales bacterium]
MTERPRVDTAEPRYTFLLIPEDGRGVVLERSWTRRRLSSTAIGAATVIGLLGLAAVLQLVTLPRVLVHDDVLAENAALRAEVIDTRAQLAELEPLIQRVRAYDEQLRTLAAKGALPGFGPLDEESMAERDAWIRGVVGGASPAESPADLGLLTQELLAIDLDGLDENLARLQQANEAMPQLWPVEGYVSSSFGWRRDPFGRRRWKFHGGLDIGADYGTPILTTGAGVVTYAGWHSGHGRMIEVDHGQEVVTRYCHASQLLASVGDDVLAGDTVALVGSSGMSTGAHLHYELFLAGERVDPLPYLPAAPE